MSGALAGLRVIDCSRLIAGGVLATTLADHGADVIKVENPRGGDPLRTWLRERGELWWKIYARGKRSVTLNLTEPRGQALVFRHQADRLSPQCHHARAGQGGQTQAPFIDPVVKEIPLEYSIELNRLINMEMEGSVG